MTDLMRAEAYEVPAGTKSMAVNFNNVECVFEVEHGFLVCFASGMRCFVSKEQRESIVKTMEVKRD